MTISKKIIGLLILLLGLSFLGVALGSVLVSFDADNEIIFKLRIPRTITAIIAGAGIHGIHKVKTLIRFDIINKKPQNMEVIELGNRV